MTTDETNPYQASSIDPKPPKPAGQRAAMEYMRAIQYVFESPKWMMNLLWGSLCILSTSVIPIVGQLLWIGYQFEVVEDLVRNPQRQGYTDFDLNRFKEYLMRGVWVFLVSLVLMVVIMPLTLGFFFGGAAVMAGVLSAAQGDDAAAMIGVIVMMALGFVLLIMLSIVLNVLMTPVMIRAGLTQDFRDSFDFAWIKDFVRQMWVETIFAGLFLMAVGMCAMLIGMLACVVGVYPAMCAVSLAQGHLYLQLYQMYLGRGGQPITLKPLDVKPPVAM